jgi:sugar phosphate isomerase/epimerase
MLSRLSRRDLLHSAAAAGLAVATAPAVAAPEPPKKDPFGYCLNTSTISGQKLDLIEEVEIAAKAGYDGIEPWVRELDQYVKGGGDLKELGKRIQDRGLTVASAIGFCEWIVDDAEKRKKGLEEGRRSMDLVQQIGGKRIAAPPAGATNQAGMDPLVIAERYRALLEIGDKIGVVAMAEMWAHSKPLHRLSDAALVAIESGHPKACILADVFHLYKSGSDFKGMHLLSADALPHLHINDYPAMPPRAEITDAARVYPGDGVAPLKDMLRDLRQLGFRGMLSLELFNRDFWKQDALQVAKTGLEKMKAVVKASLDL